MRYIQENSINTIEEKAQHVDYQEVDYAIDSIQIAGAQADIKTTGKIVVELQGIKHVGASSSNGFPRVESLAQQDLRGLTSGFDLREVAQR